MESFLEKKYAFWKFLYLSETQIKLLDITPKGLNLRNFCTKNNLKNSKTEIKTLLSSH